MHVDGDNSLQGSVPNGVNNHSLDLPDYNGAPLQLNGDPRNTLPYFNVAAYSDNALGTAGNASRRSFYGPGALNFDLALLQKLQILRSQRRCSSGWRVSTHSITLSFGPAAVNGDVDSALFGQVVKAQPPRLVQIALKFTY